MQTGLLERHLQSNMFCLYTNTLFYMATNTTVTITSMVFVCAESANVGRVTARERLLRTHSFRSGQACR